MLCKKQVGLKEDCTNDYDCIGYYGTLAYQLQTYGKTKTNYAKCDDNKKKCVASNKQANLGQNCRWNDNCKSRWCENDKETRVGTCGHGQKKVGDNCGGWTESCAPGLACNIWNSTCQKK